MLSLPIAFADNAPPYALQTQGSIADSVYYQIGGGSVISPMFTEHSPDAIAVGAGWNSDLMCGNFDIRTTIKNQLNGITQGFHDLMGEVISSATGAVASLPAMVIQRSDPQLYDLLTNGILQGRLDFDRSLLSCEKMSKKLGDLAFNSTWTDSAKAENYQTVASANTDAVRADLEAKREAAEKGKRWVGGQRRGGRGQPPIRLVHDAAAAGYNLLNNRSATDSSSIPTSDCRNQLCTLWQSPEQSARWLTRVVGEQTVNVCRDCNTGTADTNKTSSQAGIGLNPLIQQEQQQIRQTIIELVKGSLRPTEENLAKGSGGSLLLTRGVVEALRDDPDATILIERLSGEMALARVMEQALAARRTLLAGMREPNIADEKTAQYQLNGTLTQLDEELSQLKLELDVRHELADNAASKILERQQLRTTLKGKAVAVGDDVDKRVNDLQHQVNQEVP
ncbi:integrating conjugative element protein (TIGR03755 family) [Erwinia toletana]|uniref:Integrating conjugative element protein (TIGR03755 family) n=1 Tax=Winslowiella toletana TaxID=92490 RepID=A0ABS4PDJ3_9GAMM|nr:integrating conjugative element protein [Winslowiella toletana]MBP2170708.1 integrating conjugative element protein (TIGR03755 family) [Winslowiella toletana]